MDKDNVVLEIREKLIEIKIKLNLNKIHKKDKTVKTQCQW
jgi:hypothetical protein